MPQYPFQTSDTYTPDHLIAGPTELATRSYTVAAGANLTRGTMVGVITTSGKLTTSTTAASDGSQTPLGILADDANAAAADVGNVPVYLKGEFNEAAVVLGTGWTPVSAFAALRPLGIFLKPSVKADGSYSS